MFSLSYSLLPSAAFIAAAFQDLGFSLNDTRSPLQQIVDEVMAPSIATNFEVGGRPGWEPLSPATIKTGGGQILVRTGALAGAASSPGSWSVGDDAAQLDGVGIDYAYFHQYGTSKMPAREWAVIQPEDEARMEELFGDWVDSKIGLW